MPCMVSLVGAQAAPNVLPLDRFKPQSLVLVYTNTTQKVAENTAKLLSSDYPRLKVDLLCLENAYEFEKICADLDSYLKKSDSNEGEFIFNLTGGTKMMSLAAFELAKQRSSHAFYFQSEENKNLIYNFKFNDEPQKIGDVEQIDKYITLDQFLRLYLGECEERPYDDQNVFENKVINSLEENLGQEFEIKPRVCPKNISGNIEIDFVIRYQNVFAVGEIKETANKRSFEQLNSICSPDVLGTYTKKFIIHTNELDKNNQDLMKAYNIVSIRLPSGIDPDLSKEDRNTLLEMVTSTITHGKDRL